MQQNRVIVFPVIGAALLSLMGLASIPLEGSNTYTFVDDKGKTIEKTLPNWVDIHDRPTISIQTNRGWGWAKITCLITCFCSCIVINELAKEEKKLAEKLAVGDYFGKEENFRMAQIQTMANLATYAEVADIRAARKYQEELAPYLESSQYALAQAEEQQKALIAEAQAQQDRELKQALLEGQTLDEINDPKNKVESGGGSPQLPGVKFFDWQDVKNIDNFPYIRLIGVQGSGKTTLATWLASEILKGLIAVIATKINPLKPGQTKRDWDGFKVVGANPPMDYQAMSEEIKGLRVEMGRRFTPGAKPNPKKLTYILDDWSTTPAFLEKIDPDFTTNFIELVVNGRGANIAFIALVHSDRVEPSGLKGMNDLKQQLPAFYLKNAALSMIRFLASKKPDKYGSICQWMEKQKRPCLVYTGAEYLPAEIPDLSDFKQQEIVNKTPEEARKELLENNSLQGVIADYKRANSYQEVIERLLKEREQFCKWARQKGRVTVRESKQNFRPFRDIPSEMIQGFFFRLEECENDAQIQENGKTLIFVNESRNLAA